MTISHVVEQDGGNMQTAGELAQGRILSPGQSVINDLTSNGWLKQNGIYSPDPTFTVTIDVLPNHGRMESLPAGEFRYTPHPKYVGRDFVSFIVNIEGKKIRTNFVLIVTQNIEDPKGQNDNVDAPVAVQLGTAGWATWAKSAEAYASIALVSPPARPFSGQPRDSVGICLVGFKQGNYRAVIDPAVGASAIVSWRPEYGGTGMFPFEGIVSNIITPPKHGILADDRLGGFTYEPYDGYIGNDLAVFSVKIPGETLNVPDRIVKVTYFIKVVGNLASSVDSDRLQKQKCPIPSSWRLSSSSTEVDGESAATWI